MKRRMTVEKVWKREHKSLTDCIPHMTHVGSTPDYKHHICRECGARYFRKSNQHGTDPTMHKADVASEKDRDDWRI